MWGWTSKVSHTQKDLPIENPNPASGKNKKGLVKSKKSGLRGKPLTEDLLRPAGAESLIWLANIERTGWGWPFPHSAWDPRKTPRTSVEGGPERI